VRELSKLAEATDKVKQGFWEEFEVSGLKAPLWKQNPLQKLPSVQSCDARKTSFIIYLDKHWKCTLIDISSFQNGGSPGFNIELFKCPAV